MNYLFREVELPDPNGPHQGLDAGHILQVHQILNRPFMERFSGLD